MVYAGAELGAGGGDAAISVMSIITTVENLMIMIIMGINQGVSPIISYNYGRGNYERVKYAALTGQAIAAVITVSVWLIAMLNPQMLFKLFGCNEELCEYGTRAIRKSKMFLLFLGFQQRQEKQSQNHKGRLCQHDTDFTILFHRQQINQRRQKQNRIKSAAAICFKCRKNLLHLSFLFLSNLCLLKKHALLSPVS